MFFLPSSRFKFIRIYHEDPTGSTLFSKSKQATLFRFFTLLFYSFLFNYSNWVPFSFTDFKKPYWSWVYNNKYRIMQWDVLRRYNYKLLKLLRMTSYKKSLLEYKKLKYFYFTLRDYQFRKFALKGVPLYVRFKLHFLSFLELRLLTLCVRLGFYNTHICGRQELSHFGILIDNKRVYHSNYVVKVGSTLLLKPFVGFNNFKLGFDSLRRPSFIGLGRLVKFWVPNNISATYGTISNFITHRPIYGYSDFKATKSLLELKKSVFFKSYAKIKKKNALSARKQHYYQNFSNKFFLGLRNNWFKVFEFFIFSKLSKQRQRVQTGLPIFKGKDDFLRRQKKKSLNPLIYEGRYEDRAIDISILNSQSYLAPRLMQFDRSIYPIFFRYSPFFNSTFRRKNIMRLRRKLFYLLPKPYMLVSWALKKIYLIGAPRLQDVTFPFLADPTLAFGFINSK